MADESSQQAQNAGVNPWLIAISVMLATFMEVLDTAIASVALPYIAGSLSASNDEATWVLTSYLVANAVILPASNWFSLKFGRKRFLLTCVVIFTVSSFFCGAAPTLGIMLLARVVQGAGGGALQPLSQAILLESFPPQKRGIAMTVFAFGVVVAPVLGPTLGGWLTDTYSWRYAFYINIPVGALALFMISRFVHDPPYIKNAKAGKFDNLGFGLLAVWTGCLQVILDKGQEDDWFGAAWIRWATFFLVTSFIWFVWHSWRSKSPLVNLKTLKNWNFAIGCLLIAMFGLCIYSMITILPLFYQDLLGYTAFTAGLVVGPRGIGSILGMPVIGYLGSKVDARYLLTFGFVVFGIMSLFFGNLTLDIGPTTLLLPIIVTGFALSFVFVPITTQAYGTLRNEQIGSASGIFNLLRNIGGSIGISVAQTLLTRRTDAHQNEIANYVPRSGVWFEQQTSALRNYLGHMTNPANTQGVAYGRMYTELGQQAQLWSFVDVFRWMSLLSFACVAMVWLFRKVVPGRKAPAGAH
ncbi:DHA2 family efflux MFS transporter permease subunit [Silvibacterium dinghuense]|uniref:DHA2 family efflux MFS transporter permease subunit n=1 Tax=Silvibacterium dinghuense TaxID=1560006 RepID=A0A4Q1SF01_9BACT|nr:DHA2 family efflux MFS transporter permease subunit [Silvibacterium dinghuense]RXS95675.1 DHA2 family efflux MFS transporter permease subunit [Silvibacterium dinghuense]GGH14862.1 EmrB/QacA family drug resistance transporter [Silvibacterium dinghuense]